MALIRRVLIGPLGVALTVVGLALFLAIYAPDLYAVPLPPWKQAVVLIAGVAGWSGWNLAGPVFFEVQVRTRVNPWRSI